MPPAYAAALRFSSAGQRLLPSGYYFWLNIGHARFQPLVAGFISSAHGDSHTPEAGFTASNDGISMMTLPTQ